MKATRAGIVVDGVVYPETDDCVSKPSVCAEKPNSVRNDWRSDFVSWV